MLRHCCNTYRPYRMASAGLLMNASKTKTGLILLSFVHSTARSISRTYSALKWSRVVPRHILGSFLSRRRFPSKVEHAWPPAVLFNAPKAIRDSPFQVNELHLVAGRRFFYLQSQTVTEQFLNKPAPQGVYVHVDGYQLLSNRGPSI